MHGVYAANRWPWRVKVNIFHTDGTNWRICVSFSLSISLIRSLSLSSSLFPFHTNTHKLNYVHIIFYILYLRGPVQANDSFAPHVCTVNCMHNEKGGSENGLFGRAHGYNINAWCSYVSLYVCRSIAYQYLDHSDIESRYILLFILYTSTPTTVSAGSTRIYGNGKIQSSNYGPSSYSPKNKLACVATHWQEI